jgi:hypothetical protein
MCVYRCSAMMSCNTVQMMSSDGYLVEQVEYADHRAVHDIFTGVVVADVTNQVPDVATT